MFYENGPYHINPDLSLERSEYGWDTNSNMIFVDQPINTGFSYSDVSMFCSCSAYSAVSWTFNPKYLFPYRRMMQAHSSACIRPLLMALRPNLQDPRDRVFDEHTVAEDMLDFLQAFLEGVAALH